MFLQIGNHQFSIPNSPDSFSHTDETEYAQHDLMGVKPVLQPSANSLEEVSLTIQLHAEFCNVAQTIADLKTSKDSFEVLPILFGNGRYLMDAVITSLQQDWVESFEDGTPNRVSLSVSLKEYQTADKLAQQQNAARKNAFAVGDKKPVNIGLVQPATIPQQASVNIAAVNSESGNIDSAVSQYDDNVSKQPFLITQMQTSLQNINTNLDAFNNQFQNIQYLFTDVVGVQNAVTSVSKAVTKFSFDHLTHSNLQLQNANQQLQLAIVPMNYNIMDRRA
jgi:phage protein U